MKIIKSNLFIIAAIAILTVNFALAESKTIRFNESERIVQVMASQKYVSAIIHNRVSHENVVYFWDKKGSEIYRKEVGREWIEMVFPNELYNNFIIIEQGWERSPEKITAYDIDTKSVKWESTTNGMRFDISPDNRYLIPESPPDERKFTFEVIDLSNGTKLDLSHSFSGHQGAVWLDNDRVIIGFNEEEIDPEYSRKYKIEKDPIQYQIDQKGKLLLELMQRKKSSAEDSTLNIQIQEIRSEIEQLMGKLTRPIEEKRFRNKASKIIIYNIKSDELELERAIYDSQNEKFIFNAGIGKVSVLSYDREKNIYLIGHGPNGNDETKLLKLDKFGNLIWTSHLGRYANIVKTCYNGEIYYTKKIGDGNYRLVNNKTGKLMDDFESGPQKSIFLEILPKNINPVIHGYEFNAFDDIKIDRFNNNILFF